MESPGKFENLIFQVWIGPSRKWAKYETHFQDRILLLTCLFRSAAYLTAGFSHERLV